MRTLTRSIALNIKGCRKSALVLMFGLLIFGSWTSHVSAAVTITVKGTELNPGQSGFINVFIRSNGLDPDLLDLFGIEVQITPVIGTQLAFTDPPLDPQLIDPNYIFFNNSAAAIAPPAGNINAVSKNYIGGDGTLDFQGVSVPTTDTLLASIQVKASPGSIGDLFLVSVVPTSATYFLDPNLQPLTVVAFVSGQVAITPEPSSLCCMCGLMTIGLVRAWTSRKNRR